MDKRQKIIKLIEHYKTHNEEHARSYSELVPLVSELENPRLTDIVERLSQESQKLNPLFEEALKILKEG
jgi:hypothetical protein